MRYARGEQPTKEDLTPAGEKWRLRRDPNLGSQGATLRGAIRPAGGGNLSNVVLTVWEVDARGRRIDLIADRQKVNKDGSYEVRYISPGQYIVTAEDLQFTPTARFVGESGKIQLEQGQTHPDVNLFLHSEPAGQVTIRVIAPRELHDRVFVWLRDVQMDSLGGSPYKFAGTAELDEKNTASFESIPYGLYDVYVMLTNEDTRKPSWTHDELQVKLTGRIAEGVVELRKPGEE
jgi:hypothetical protein